MTLTTSVETTPATEAQPGFSQKHPKRRLTRRAFLTLSAASLGGLALYAGEVSRHELSIETVTLPLPRLPDAFRGLRIVQVSDFHYAEFTEPYFLREMVDHVNRLQPDMVVLTGDFVSYAPLGTTFGRRCAPKCAEILSRIDCPTRYASLGNHDYYVGWQYVAGPLRDAGIPVLVNAAIPLERQGQRLWLAGLGSACSHAARPAEALPKAVLKAKEAVIVLAHEPDILPEVARYGVDLMLSGHTHGGQVRIPFLPLIDLPEYGKRYVEGLFHHGATQLYVNRGIGTVGVPFRFRCPPEITVITLA